MAAESPGPAVFVPAAAGALPADALDLEPGEAEERFRRARADGRPFYVWPELPVPAWRAALRALEAAAARLLTEDGTGVRLERPADVPARAVGIAAFTSGLGPLLGWWLEAGRLEADDDVAALLRLHLLHGRERADRLGRELGTALDVLWAAGVEAVVLKGAHTGRIYFPEPGTRPSADLDLLVAAADMETAERSLRGAGYVLRATQTRPRRAEWLPPDAPRAFRSLELNHRENPYELDVHTSLERDFFGVRTVKLETVGATSPCPALHPRARVLAGPTLPAYLALHASEGLHNLTLLRLVELISVVRAERRAGRLEWDELADLLDERGAARFAYPAFELAERLAPGLLPPRLRQRLTGAATPAMRRVLRDLRPADVQRPEGLALAERFMWARGPVELARRAAEMLWPRWMRRSGADLRRIYGERLFRLLRGRVGLGGRPPAD